MNMQELRNLARTRLGLPTLGEKALATFNAELSAAIRRVTTDIPDLLSRHTYQFRLEVPFETGTLHVDPDDPRVFWIDGLTLEEAGAFNRIDPGLFRGRQLEIFAPASAVDRADEGWVTCTIRDVAASGDLIESPPIIIVDRPWRNTTDDELVYRIYTEDYPVPAKAVSVTQLRISPETNPVPLQRSRSHADLLLLRQSSTWRTQARPYFYSTGDFNRLPPMRQTPVASVVTGDPPAYKWGYPAGTQVTRGGPAGKFRYSCALVLGRRPHPEFLTGGTTTGLFPNKVGTLAPRVISSATPPTALVETTWGSGAIKITSSDADYVAGYGATPALLSYRHSGLEKWWFRARFSEEDGGNSIHKGGTESDGRFYLWKITPAWETATYDDGSADPVDTGFPLDDFHGHQSIRFERAPAIAELARVELVSQPETGFADSDVAPVPPESIDLILAALKVARAERDGDRAALADAALQYKNECQRLARNRAMADHSPTEFGHAYLEPFVGNYWLPQVTPYRP